METIHKLLINTEHASYESDSSEDPYYKAFLNDMSLRPSCYDCQFKGVERGCDITLGDFWGIDKIRPEVENESGTSLVLVHSEKGDELMRSIINELLTEEIDLSEILGKHNLSLTESCKEHPSRREFFNDTESDFRIRVNRYCFPMRKSLGYRLIRKIKRIIVT